MPTTQDNDLVIDGGHGASAFAHPAKLRRYVGAQHIVHVNDANGLLLSVTISIITAGFEAMLSRMISLASMPG